MADVVADRYEIGARIGAGGMAEVFEAHDRRLDRRVAVKFLRTDVQDPRARERFEREARAAASFNHPNAVTIFDVGEEGSRPYLVLELVEGSSLAEVLSQRGPLDQGEAVGIIDQILAALGAAHARGLVHRDVKPSNILLTDGGVAKLADFGIAKAVADAAGDMTATGQVLGTPRYLSPEQVSGEPATPQSDLYAVGVVLYEMLSGEPPFSGETPFATALAHQQSPVPPLASRRPGLDPRVVAAVERALEKDPARRFANAEAMREALTPAASIDATVPMAAAPTTVMPVPVPLQRGTRSKRRWVAPLAVAVAIAIVVALILAARNGSGNRPLTTAPPVTTTPSTTAPSTTARRTTVAPTTSPRTISGLIALLTATPGLYGKHGQDLLNRLQQIQREIATKPNDKATRNDAAHAVKDISHWIQDGGLTPAIGALAQQLLQPFAASAASVAPPPAAGTP